MKKSEAGDAGQSGTELSELIVWLENESEKLMGQVISRRSSANTMRNATSAELRSAKKMAENMHGRKLPGVGTDTESAKAGADMDDRIATKIEREARQLSAWADMLRSEVPISAPLPEPPNGRLDPTKCYCAECYQPLGSGPCTKVEEGKRLNKQVAHRETLPAPEPAEKGLPLNEAPVPEPEPTTGLCKRCGAMLEWGEYDHYRKRLLCRVCATWDSSEPITTEPPARKDELGTTRIYELRKALKVIRDGGKCGCDHSTEDCCFVVDEYCPVCTAAITLNQDDIVAPQASPEAPANLSAEQFYDSQGVFNFFIEGSKSHSAIMKFAEAYAARLTSLSGKHPKIYKFPNAPKNCEECDSECFITAGGSNLICHHCFLRAEIERLEALLSGRAE